MIYDIAILGAGAAGLFAGAQSSGTIRTVIIDHNRTAGKKLLLAGSGQCNLTHGGTIKDFLNHYGPNGSRLRPVLFPYSNQAVTEFFNTRGVPLIEREDGKIFPRSLQGKDVLDTLLTACRENGVDFQYSTQVVALDSPSTPSSPIASTSSAHHDPQAAGCWTLTLSGGSGQPPHTLKARCVLVATGGCSYAQTGSDGSLFPILEKLDVPLIRRRPALAPLFVQAYPFAELSGISFPNARLTLRKQDPTVRRNSGNVVLQGPVLLTHSCFSGPAILSLSRYVSPGDQLEICWNAELSEEKLACCLTPGASGKSLATLLAEQCQLPKRFVEQLCTAAEISPEKKTDQLSKKERRSVISKILQDTYSISGTAGFPAAMVTAGGVDLNAVNLKTMESKTHVGLYFAGEVLDIDGDTGGYNLQFAFSSGRLAIRSAISAAYPSSKTSRP